MTLNQVQENIYDLIRNNQRIRSDKISALLNQSRERIRREISIMVLAGLIDGNLNHGYVLNQVNDGLITTLNKVVVSELTANAIVLDHPKPADLVFYQTMAPVDFIISKTENIESIYLDGRVEKNIVSETDSLFSLDFSDKDSYIVIGAHDQVKGCITKERFEDYFVNLLQGN